MSLSIPIILLVTTLLLVILVLSLYARHLATRDARLFTELAKKFKGKMVIDSFSTWATAEFPYERTKVTVFQRKGLAGKRARTCIKCSLHLEEYWALHVAQGVTAETTIGELGQWFLVPKVRVGSDEFHKTFVVHGNDNGFLEEVVTPDFQKRFLKLKRKDPTFYLHTQKRIVGTPTVGKTYEHLLEFSVSEVPNNFDELHSLVKRGLWFVHQVLPLATTPNR